MVRVGGSGPLTGLLGGAFQLAFLALRWAVVGTAVVAVLMVAGTVWAVRSVARRVEQLDR